MFSHRAVKLKKGIEISNESRFIHSKRLILRLLWSWVIISTKINFYSIHMNCEKIIYWKRVAVNCTDLQNDVQRTLLPSPENNKIPNRCVTYQWYDITLKLIIPRNHRVLPRTTNRTHLTTPYWHDHAITIVTRSWINPNISVKDRKRQPKEHFNPPPEEIHLNQSGL